jgi:hypothetical protein
LADKVGSGDDPEEQEIWRTKLAQAEVRYAEAGASVAKAVALNEGVADAAARKRAAREEYLRLLRIFSDLVMRGKSPPTKD